MVCKKLAKTRPIVSHNFAVLNPNELGQRYNTIFRDDARKRNYKRTTNKNNESFLEQSTCLDRRRWIIWSVKIECYFLRNHLWIESAAAASVVASAVKT